MTLWAFSVASLGALYVACARLWPRVASRHFVAHGHHVPEGWRIGSAIAWRLPFRASLVVLLAALMPASATFVLPSWALAVLLTLFGTAFAVLWLLAPPGHRLVVSDATASTGPHFHIVRSEGRPLRALAVFILFGALPSMFLGLLAARALDG